MYKKIILVLLTILILEKQSLSMEEWWSNPQVSERLAREFEESAKDIGNEFEQIQREKARRMQEKKDFWQQKYNRAHSEEEKRFCLQQIANIENAEMKSAEGWDEAGRNAVNLITKGYGTAFKMIKNEHNAKLKREQTAIKAEMQRRASVENVKQTLEAMTDPKNIRNISLAATGVAAGTLLCWHGFKLGAKMIEHVYRNPTLAQETSLLSLIQKLNQLLFGSNTPIENKVSDVILEPELAQRVADLAESVKNTVSNNAYFRHILFYGPPGTGKTMLAKRIARSSGLEYIYFAASSLDQYSLEEGLIKLQELFSFAEKSSKKLMIIIDEAEMLLANRAKELSEKSRKLLNFILTYTGTETDNFLVVALTNRPEDLDDAFLSRCDEQIYVGPPALEQRKQILRMYLEKYLINPSTHINQGLLGRFFVARKRKPITIEDNALTDTTIDEIAQKLDNFTGRDIAKLVISLQAAANVTANACLTRDIINKVVDLKIKQKQTNLKKFAGNNDEIYYVAEVTEISRKLANPEVKK